MKKLLFGLIFLVGCTPQFGRTDFILSDVLEVKPELSAEGAIRYGLDSLETYQADLEDSIKIDNPLIYKEGGKSISFKPTEIRWDTGASIKNELADVKRSKISNRYDYKNIYGQGFDLQIKTEPTRFSKVIKIDNISRLGIIPEDAKYLEVEFQVITDFNLPVDIIAEPIELSATSTLELSQAWDSFKPSFGEDGEELEEENKVEILSEIISRQGKKYLVKKLPVDWLQTAQFPIFTDVDITYGTRQSLAVNQTHSISVVELDTDKFVACFHDDDENDATCRVGTVSGTTITYGSNFDIDSTISTGIPLALCATKLDTDKFIVIYEDSASSMSAIVATTTGTTITTNDADKRTNVFSGLVVGSGHHGWQYCEQLDTDTAVAAVQQTSDSSGEARIFSVNSGSSGSTITLGTTNTFTTDVPRWMNICSLTVDEGTFALFYENQTDSDNLKVQIATTTGTTINGYTTAENVATTPGNDILPSCAKLDDDKVVVTWQDQAPAPDTLEGRILTIDDSENVTFGTQVTIFADDPLNIVTRKVDSTRFVTVFGDNNATDDGTSVLSSFSGTTITAGSGEVFDSSSISGSITDFGMGMALISSLKISICYQDDGGTDDPSYCIIGDVAALVTDENPVSDFWLHSGNGILKSNNIIIKQ